jgi:farnesyl-diphosphate farnesyltransferase
VPRERRLLLLAQFRNRILRKTDRALDLANLAGVQTSASERVLLGRIEEALTVLSRLTPPDQERIREVLGIIISGQALDVERFADADSSHVAALESHEQLDDYTYRVAGCVGEFWTKMCRAHLFPEAPLDDGTLLANGVRFGKGLQLVNVLRDLSKDLRLGRCYLPASRLAKAGLSPSDLLDPAAESRFRGVYDKYLEIAGEHLLAGWSYTNQLPFRCVRIRLACAWPILIGKETLAKLQRSAVLDPAYRIRITRREVRRIIFRSVLCYAWPSRWRQLFTADFGAGFAVID